MYSLKFVYSHFLLNAEKRYALIIDYFGIIKYFWGDLKFPS